MKYRFAIAIIICRLFFTTVAAASQNGIYETDVQLYPQAGYSQEFDDGIIIYKDAVGGTVIHFLDVPKIIINGQDIEFEQKPFILLTGYDDTNAYILK